MKPRYHRILLDYEPYIGPKPRSTGVFVKQDQSEPIAGDLRKDWWPEKSLRQPYFEAQVRRLVEILRSRCIPVHIEWNQGIRNQLDKGCIGHSFASNDAFIESVARNFDGEITHIIIRDTHAPNQ